MQEMRLNRSDLQSSARSLACPREMQSLRCRPAAIIAAIIAAIKLQYSCNKVAKQLQLRFSFLYPTTLYAKYYQSKFIVLIHILPNMYYRRQRQSDIRNSRWMNIYHNISYSLRPKRVLRNVTVQTVFRIVSAVTIPKTIGAVECDIL